MLATEAHTGRGVRRLRGARPARRPGPWVESAALPPRRPRPRGRGHRHRRRAAARAVRAGRGRRRRGLRRRHAGRRRSATMHRSVDRTRRLFEVTGDGEPVALDEAVRPGGARHLGPAARRSASGCSPTRSTYVKQRKQFGREIGSLPGDQARARRRPDRARLRPAAGLRRRARRDLRPSAAKVACRRRGVPRLPHRPPGARRDRLHRRVRPEHLADQGPRAGRRVGHAGVPPRVALLEELTADGVRAHRGAAGARRRPCGRCWPSAPTAPPCAPRSSPRPATTRRCGRRSASRSASPRWPIPEEYDGAGFSLFETVVVLEELGRSLAPVAPAGLAGRRRGAAGRRRRATPGTAAPPDRRRRGRRRSSLDDDPVLVRRPGHRAARGRAATTCCELDPASSDPNGCPPWTRPAASGQLDASRRHAGSATARLPATGPSWSAPSASPRSRPACAAARLEMTVAYSKERVQFGRPIGSFQALKHRMADMLVLVEMSPLGVVGGVVRRRRSDAGNAEQLRARREVLLLRRARPGRRRDRPAARRHRDHLGARRPAGLQARARAGPAVRPGARRTGP